MSTLATSDSQSGNGSATANARAGASALGNIEHGHYGLGADSKAGAKASAKTMSASANASAGVTGYGYTEHGHTVKVGDVSTQASAGIGLTKASLSIKAKADLASYENDKVSANIGVNLTTGGSIGADGVSCSVAGIGGSIGPDGLRITTTFGGIGIKPKFGEGGPIQQRNDADMDGSAAAMEGGGRGERSL